MRRLTLKGPLHTPAKLGQSLSGNAGRLRVHPLTSAFSLTWTYLLECALGYGAAASTSKLLARMLELFFFPPSLNYVIILVARKCVAHSTSGTLEFSTSAHSLSHTFSSNPVLIEQDFAGPQNHGTHTHFRRGGTSHALVAEYPSISTNSRCLTTTTVRTGSKHFFSRGEKKEDHNTPTQDQRDGTLPEIR